MASKVPSSTVRASVDRRQDARQARRTSPPRRPDRRCRGRGRRWPRPSRHPLRRFPVRGRPKTAPKKPKATRPRVPSPRRPIRRRRPWSSTTTSEIRKMKSAPETGALPRIELSLRSLDFDHLGLAIADWDLAGLLRLGNLTHEIDVQESVLERRALDLDVVGKLEDALERAGRDALIEHLAAVLLVLRLFLAFDRQRVFLRFDRKLAWHNLVVERNAGGPPQRAGPVARAAPRGLRATHMGIGSGTRKRLNRLKSMRDFFKFRHVTNRPVALISGSRSH